jgi:hypothetical protein
MTIAVLARYLAGMNFNDRFLTLMLCFLSLAAVADLL